MAKYSHKFVVSFDADIPVNNDLFATIVDSGFDAVEVNDFGLPINQTHVQVERYKEPDPRTFEGFKSVDDPYHHDMGE